MKTILDYLFANPGAVVTAIIAALAFVKGRPFVDTALASKRAAMLFRYAEIAFKAVEEADAVSPLPTAVMKMEAFARKFCDLVVASGLPAPSALELKAAQHVADGLHLETRESPPPPAAQ